MPLKSKRSQRRQPPKLYWEWIRRLGRKPVEIAKAVDITESYLSELISGKKPNPGPWLIAAVEEELGIGPGGLRHPPPPETAVEAAGRLDPAKLAALGALLDEIKRK